MSTFQHSTNGKQALAAQGLITLVDRTYCWTPQHCKSNRYISPAYKNKADTNHMIEIYTMPFLPSLRGVADWFSGLRKGAIPKQWKWVYFIQHLAHRSVLEQDHGLSINMGSGETIYCGGVPWHFCGYPLLLAGMFCCFPWRTLAGEFLIQHAGV